MLQGTNKKAVPVLPVSRSITEPEDSLNPQEAALYRVRSAIYGNKKSSDKVRPASAPAGLTGGMG